MKRTGYVCQLCSSSIRSARRSRSILSSVATVGRSQQRFNQSASGLSLPTSAAPTTTNSAKKTHDKTTQFWGNDWTVFSADNAALVRKAQTSGDQILNSKTIPSEEDVLRTLEIIKYAALQIASTKAFKQSSASLKTKEDTVSKAEKTLSATKTTVVPHNKNAPNFMADILSLNEATSNPVSVSISINLLSTLAFKIVRHPPVFITAKILETYVAIQTSLRRITTLPEVFDLYTHKPCPVPDSSPIRYADPTPSKASQAVPKEIADQALDSAIKDRELTLALDIISATYAMPAFRTNRFVRKALPAIVGLTITPFAALPFARAWGESSLAADPSELTAYAFLGVLVYVTSLSGIGFVAVTTANDQMERVTWLTGTPLRNRWLREDERAATDKVAMAWGFAERERRGEEEGAEWELLKAWCGQRGMVLDASELMEGME